MVKKCLIAIALLAFLSTTVQAGDLAENPIKIDWGDRWPWTYLELEICQIPVYMEVGMYVKVIDCHKLEIILKQVKCDSIGKGDGDFPCYEGCTDVKIQANFEVKLNTKFYKDPINDIINKYSISLSDDVVSPPGETVTLCMQAWKAKLQNHAPGSKVPVGEIAILVKPNA